METETHEHVSLQVRRYLYVFYCLLFGTLVTVGASYIPWGHPAINIAVALFIAICKASLVACFFMHLISERRMVYGILGFTAFFVAGLMFLTLWSHADFPLLTRTH